MKLFTSLYSTILFYYGSSLIIVGSCLVGVVIFLEQQRLYNELEIELSNRAITVFDALLLDQLDSFKKRTKYRDNHHNPAQLRFAEENRDNLEEQGYEFISLNADSRILYKTKDSIRWPIAQLQQAAQKMSIEDTVTYRYNKMFHVVKLGLGGETFIIRKTLEPAYESLKLITLKFAFISFVCVLISTLLGSYIIKRALMPVSLMSSTANEIAKGNLDARTTVLEPKSELGILTKHINSSYSALQQSFEQQRQFTANASHEMRTPIAILLSKVQLALRKERSTSDYQKTLQACLPPINQLKSLINNLLLLARIDANEQLNESTKISDYRKTVHDVVDQIREYASEKDISVQVGNMHKFTQPLRDIYFTQVLQNLLSNAVKYGKTGGWISLYSESTPEWNIIHIKDNGIGVDKKHLPKLFKRFYQVDQSRNNDSTGLGLSIAQSLMQSVDGKIEVVSKQGRGSTFSLYFPPL